MRHPSPPFLRTLNTYVRFARVFRAANCCCAVSRAVLAAVSQDPRSACCRLSRPLLAARFAALFLSQRRFVAVI